MSFTDYEAEREYQNERFRQSEILTEILAHLKKVSTPRAYGLWGGNGWWQRADGETIHYPTRQSAAAELHNGQRNLSYRETEVREIGPDGLPVPLENE